MTKWMSIVGLLGVVGCTLDGQAPDMANAESQAVLAQSQALIDACASLEAKVEVIWAELGPESITSIDMGSATSMTDEQIAKSITNFERENYLTAYCDQAEFNRSQLDYTDYCMQRQTEVPEPCRTGAAPLLECVRDMETSVAVDCAELLPSEGCMPQQPTRASVVPGGLNASCNNNEPMVYVGGFGPAEYGFSLPPSQTEPCPDGHVYAVNCSVLSDCDMTCKCYLDKAILNEVTVSGINFADPSPTVMQACGWTL